MFIFIFKHESLITSATESNTQQRACRRRLPHVKILSQQMPSSELPLPPQDTPTIPEYVHYNAGLISYRVSPKELKKKEIEMYRTAAVWLAISGNGDKRHDLEDIVTSSKKDMYT